MKICRTCKLAMFTIPDTKKESERFVSVIVKCPKCGKRAPDSWVKLRGDK